MLIHYLKIAFRNMRKYKNQTLISVLGLAVGFTCFALATLWIRYEMTFDSFHKNAKHLYVVYIPENNPSGCTRFTYNPLAAYLKKTFPEIANAVPLFSLGLGAGGTMIVDDVESRVFAISSDSSFFRMFDVKILEGSMEFMLPNSRKLAITQEKARQLFGDENPIGKTINFNSADQKICAVVSGMPKHSNYAFDLIQPSPFAQWAIDNWIDSYSENTIIELFPGTDVEAFEKKLYEHNTGEGRGNISKMTIKPITKVRYTDPSVVREIKFQYILIFAVSGLLVILCSLFNYLTLFVSRFRIRQKELALRLVCGASNGSLLVMLSVEFILTLLFAVVLGCMLTQLVYKPFLALSDIQMNLSAIYFELLIYIGGVILVSLLIFWLILFIFRRRSINLSIRRSNNELFRKVSVVVQLMISIGFVFCTIVILKQMYFLRNSGELGFSFQNSGSVRIIDRNSGRGDVLFNQLKQIPEITEIVYAKGTLGLLPSFGGMRRRISSWDDKPVDMMPVDLSGIFVSPEYISFYNFQLVAGETLTDGDPESFVMLDETAVKAFGWHDAIGKQFDVNDVKYTVKGVIKNIHNRAPTVQAFPNFYLKPLPTNATSINVILVKYQKGTWGSCKEKIEQIIEKESDNSFVISLYNAEETYNGFLKSETALIKLLSFVSAICMLICVFGFVSLVSLTCEERRKSIAIRKINGATPGDILAMFAKEYSLLLIIGAGIAFPAGYLIMQRWLEQYVKQTSIPAWIYLSIICVLALVIVLCVGWQVYKSSIENPADVVKSE